MEKQQEGRNAGEKDSGQPRRNSGKTGPDPMEHRVDINEISPRLKNWIDSVKKAKKRTRSQTQWPRILKVPEMLRGNQDFQKFYEPRLISIGPYHRGKPHLQPGETIKPLCAKNFLADSKQDIEALYKKIESKIKEVRNCYDWSADKYDDEELAWMMLLDGCFLLHFIHRKDDMRNLLRYHHICFEEQDLYLLENQLPFGVLKLIFEEAEFECGLTMQEMIKIFVTPATGRLKEEDEEPSHLLDLLRSALLGRYKKSSKQEVESQPEQVQEAEEKGEEGEEEDGGFCCPWKKGKQQGNQQSFRHIKELKAAGIHLQRSRTSFLTDISFNSYFFYGYLNLPPITIDDSTKSMFLNIVTYEMFPEAPNDYAVTSYISFLDELIDHADDVKELRSNHILYNCLGSDDEVAQIFNQIATGLVDPGIYKGVKDRIQKHYEKKVNTWISQALHDHFSTPWTIMAFIAAVVILILTGAQTYFSLPGKSK